MATEPRQDFLHTPDGAVVFFQLYGPESPSLPTLVLCDGLGCDGFVWRYLIPQLSDRFRVLRWHYRGHGKSPAPADPAKLGVDPICADLHQLLRTTGTKSAILFGHSMGVQISLEFHRRHPETIRGLALICGSYGNPLDTFHDSTWLKTLFPYLRNMVELYPSLVDAVAHRLLKLPFLVDVGMYAEMNAALIARKDAQPYFEHLARMSTLAFVRTLDSLANHSAWDHLPRVNVPTLVVGAEDDSFTPVWLSRRMADAIPHSEFYLLPGGTHTAPLEQPELLGAKAEAFLKKVISPAAHFGQAANAAADASSPPRPARMQNAAG